MWVETLESRQHLAGTPRTLDGIQLNFTTTSGQISDFGTVYAVRPNGGTGTQYGDVVNASGKAIYSRVIASYAWGYATYDTGVATLQITMFSPQYRYSGFTLNFVNGSYQLNDTVYGTQYGTFVVVPAGSAVTPPPLFATIVDGDLQITGTTKAIRLRSCRTVLRTVYGGIGSGRLSTGAAWARSASTPAEAMTGSTARRPSFRHESTVGRAMILCMADPRTIGLPVTTGTTRSTEAGVGTISSASAVMITSKVGVAVIQLMGARTLTSSSAAMGMTMPRVATATTFCGAATATTRSSAARVKTDCSATRGTTA